MDAVLFLYHFIHLKYFIIIFFLSFLGPHPQHMEVPRLGVLIRATYSCPAYATATAMPDPSRLYDLHHSSQQCQTHWARPGIQPATSWFLVGFVNHWAMMGTPVFFILYIFISFVLFLFIRLHGIPLHSYAILYNETPKRRFWFLCKYLLLQTYYN